MSWIRKDLPWLSARRNSGKSDFRTMLCCFARSKDASLSTQFTKRQRSAAGIWQGLSSTAPPHIPWHRKPSGFESGASVPSEGGVFGSLAVPQHVVWEHESTFSARLVISPEQGQKPILHRSGQPKMAAIRASKMMRLNMQSPSVKSSSYVDRRG